LARICASSTFPAASSFFSAALAVRTSLACSPEQVFSVYTNATRVPEWRPSIRLVEAEDAVGRVGTVFTTRYRGARPRSRGRVVRSEPPRLHVLAGSGLVPFKATLCLEPIGAGTRILFVLEARVPGLLRRRVEREVRSEIERLARLAERD
jgi:uncharacterized protein YndB with AHSA1/START domain